MSFPTKLSIWNCLFSAFRNGKKYRCGQVLVSLTIVSILVSEYLFCKKVNLLRILESRNEVLNKGQSLLKCSFFLKLST